ncbi:unnamed protein product [Mytilus edulis]|uniref:Uncharacterized protein n=1 Tax=Mytilus edulis TaxID=6550 RepID=A0A8S3UL49_MYTED|nr:unnamed protein product [Mytilus edulis]
MTHSEAFSSKPDVTEKETKFRRLLGIPVTRFVRINNYCSEVDPTNAYLKTVIPSLDVPVLQLMTQVLPREQNDDIEPERDRLDIVRGHVNRYWKPGSALVATVIISMLLCGTLGIVFIVLVCVILSLFYFWKGQDLFTFLNEFVSLDKPKMESNFSFCLNHC